ncbi:hypothetical protein DFP83_11319 [Idiomarina fontislapidosi]|uniref:Uncharacterized protein n=1 Tax=Idiomarina fontislapidosi TaxID=263723 RepID=A0A432XR46_9GAMM|nr:hypothetical protein [Idiomarina fontislapidosi]PYE30821.1 hypothetical protein DFP83_11319 [Idiomarina fontislapidosi]RUO51186.1 hypothetical protein CWE25_11545 [Idiomarina fontislapidosi]
MKEQWKLSLISILTGLVLGVAIATFFRWDLSSQINWQAISAVATAIAAAATGFAAYVGLRAVDNWKQGNLHKGAVESILVFENAADNFKNALENLEFHLIRGIKETEPTGEAKKRKDIEHQALVKVALQREDEYEKLRKQLLFYAPSEEALLTANQIHRSFDGMDWAPGSSRRFKHVEVAFTPVFTRLERIKDKFR